MHALPPSSSHLLLLLLSITLLASCGPEPQTPSEDGDEPPLSTRHPALEALPKEIPAPRLTRPLTTARTELGRYLFHDARLSGNQTQSCASCHKQELAFSDGRTSGLGSTGEPHVRNVMSLTNVAYNHTFGWASHSVTSLEDQATIPMYGESPIELGLGTLEPEALLDRFRGEPRYQELFADAYPDLPPPQRITTAHVIEALADFERTLLSFDSPYDRHVYHGEEEALTASQKRGMDLFFSERLECFHCHGGFNFSDAVDHEGLAFTTNPFHNTGLYNIDGMGGYPTRDRGIYDLTGAQEDMGRFRAPTLRNIAVTAPYFHDGSAATLEEVVAHYERGGRAIIEGADFGDGSKNPNKSELIQGFILTDEERTDLIAFLHALTDTHFLTTPDLAAPADLPPVHALP